MRIQIRYSLFCDEANHRVTGVTGTEALTHMYYRITDHVALRSWSDIGFAIYKQGIRRPFPLSEKVATTMLLADGEHDMDTDDAVMLLVMRGLIEPCEKGERPSAWSAFRTYDNACFPMMNLMITGKCNFNCLHCFNAADNAANTSITRTSSFVLRRMR